MSDPANDLAKLASEIDDDRQLVEELFLRFLSRYPTERELELSIDQEQRGLVPDTLQPLLEKRIRLKQALKHSDVEALEALAMQFYGTDASRQALWRSTSFFCP